MSQNNRWLSDRHVCYVVNADWFFLSHRLPLAKRARQLGAEVTVAAGDHGHAEDIEGEGLQFHPLAVTRTGRAPIDNVKTIASLWRLYRRIRPDLVHHVSLKPVAYGSLVARCLGIPAVVNAVSGLGYNFRAGRRPTLTEAVVRFLLRLAKGHPNSRIILQNPDDCRLFLTEGLATEDQVVLIKGSGVDCDHFSPPVEWPDGPVRVVLASRMLWSKGVGEFVDAAQRLREQQVDVEMVLVGPVDDASPDGVPRDRLEDWDRQGLVKWLGYRSDMVNVFRSAHMAVLPSTYREGVPKVLIEAAAMALPIITTDTPGCREIVRDDQNGVLIPPGDSEALADSITRLASDPELRKRMGRRGRRLVVEEFSLEHVVSSTMDVYRGLLNH